jgi:aryl-alcohol dehydrogenase-like predicted oxidoreductase
VNFRKLGRTSLTVSELGFGCGVTAGMMTQGPPLEQIYAVKRALALGINYFDTAPIYGETLSEQNLGKALRVVGAEPYIATKVALSLSDLDDIKGSIFRSVKGSLERLGRSQVSIVFLHNRVGRQRAPRPDIGSGALLALKDIFGPNGVLDAFRSLQDNGLTQYFGCCAYGGDMGTVEQLVDSNAFDAVLVNYSVLNTSAWSRGQVRVRNYETIGKKSAESGLGVVALRILEAGALSGNDLAQFAQNMQGSDRHETVRRAETITFFAQAYGLNPSELAIRFALGNSQMSTALLGFSNVEQIEEAANWAAKGPLSQKIINQLEALRAVDFRYDEFEAC